MRRFDDSAPHQAETSMRARPPPTDSSTTAAADLLAHPPERRDASPARRRHPPRRGPTSSGNIDARSQRDCRRDDSLSVRRGRAAAGVAG